MQRPSGTGGSPGAPPAPLHDPQTMLQNLLAAAAVTSNAGWPPSAAGLQAGLQGLQPTPQPPQPAAWAWQPPAQPQQPPGQAAPPAAPAADAAGDEEAQAAAKLAAARERNRLAQQRFRQRQRVRAKEAGAQCEVLQEEIEQVLQEEIEHLKEEIALLREQNRMYERVLAVRDAMLATFTSLQPDEERQQRRQLQQQMQMERLQAGPGGEAGTAEAAQGLARALDQLPSEHELDAVAPVSPTSDPADAALQPRDSVATAASDAGSGVPGAAPGAGPPQFLLGEAHRTGTAGGLDGGALQGVELIPPPSNASLKQRICAWQGPEDLLEFLHRWQAEVKVAYEAGDAARWDDAAQREIDAVMARMTEMWWHVGQLRPAYLSFLAHAALPANSARCPLWRAIAAEIMPHFDERSMAIVRRSWHVYSMRIAKAATGVSRWVRRLQEYAVQDPASMAANAQRALELEEIAGRIRGAVQEEYVASMEFVAAQFQPSPPPLQAYVNCRAAPYLPDLVAIVYQMLCIDSEERQAQASAGPGYQRRRIASTLAPPSRLLSQSHAGAPEAQQQQA